MDRTRNSRVSFGFVSGKGDPLNLVTVAMDSQPVPARKHWIILSANIQGIDAGPQRPAYCGFFVCAPGTPSDPETNFGGAKIDLAIRPIRLVDASMIDGVILQSALTLGTAFELSLIQKTPVIVPANFFFRGLFGTVGGGGFQPFWQMSYSYIEEDDC